MAGIPGPSQVDNEERARQERERALYECARCRKSLRQCKSILVPCLHPICVPCITFVKKECEARRLTPHCTRCNGTYAMSEVFPHVIPIVIDDPLRCQGCNMGGAASRVMCIECKERLCDECIHAHRKVNATRHHNLQPLDLAKTPRAPILACPAHPSRPLDRWCRACEVVCCVQCLTLRHQTHPVESTQAAAQIQSGKFRTMVEKNTARLTNLRGSVNVIEQRLGQLPLLKQDLLGTLRDNIIAIRNAITHRGEKLATQIDYAVNSKQAELSRKRADAACLTDLLGQTQHLADEVLRTGNPTALMAMRQPLVKAMQRIAALQFDPNSLQESVTQQIHLSLSQTGEINKRIDNLGMVLLNHQPVGARPAVSQPQTTQAPPQPIPVQTAAVPRPALRPAAPVSVASLSPQFAGPQQRHINQTFYQQQLQALQAMQPPRPPMRSLPGLQQAPDTVQRPANGGGPPPLRFMTTPARSALTTALQSIAGPPTVDISGGGIEVLPKSSPVELPVEASAVATTPMTHNSARKSIQPRSSIDQIAQRLQGGIVSSSSPARPPSAPSASQPETDPSPPQPKRPKSEEVKTEKEPEPEPEPAVIRSEMDARTSANERDTPDATTVTSSQARGKDEWEDWCRVCNDGCGDSQEQLLCCEGGCFQVYHLNCHVPPVPDVPGEGDTWICTRCQPAEPSKIAGDDYEFMSDRAHTKLSPYELLMCRKLLLEVSSHELALPFRHPVDPSITDYYEVIKQPMDFGTIKLKLGDSVNPVQYTSPKELIEDLNRVFRNCSRYNESLSEMEQAGRRIHGVYRRKLCEFLPIWSHLLWAYETLHRAKEPSAKRQRLTADTSSETS